MSVRTDPSAYDSFAWFYDRYWGTGPMAFTQRALSTIERMVLSHLQPGAKVLDLCCGSGHLAKELTARGFLVVGIDGSAELLKYARQHAPQAQFIHADARAFSVPRPCDAAFSLYDSLNHIMELDELIAVFRNVQAALVPGGQFLFDMNMEEGFRTRWRGAFGLAEPDHAMINRSSYESTAKLAQAAVTMFRLVDGAWSRDDVTLYQRCYSEDEIRTGLARSGFEQTQSYDAERELGMERQIGRMFFLGQKLRKA